MLNAGIKTCAYIAFGKGDFYVFKFLDKSLCISLWGREILKILNAGIKTCAYIFLEKGDF